MSYSVGVSNKFDALGDGDAPQYAEEKDDKKKKGSKKQAVVAPVKAIEEPVVERVKTSDRDKSGGSQRGGRGGFRSSRQPREGQKQFDRRGAPGSHDREQPRKDGLGLGEFVGNNDEVAPTVDVVEENTAQIEAAVAADFLASIEPVVLSYDEFLVKKLEKTLFVDDVKVARAVFSDDNKWNAGVAINKKTDSTTEAVQAKVEKKKAGGKLTLDEFVSDAPRVQVRQFRGDREENFRGGRGGGRGGSRQNKINLMDKESFPALAK